MAWITPPVFVALQTLTDTVMNQLSSRLSDLFPYTTIGDTTYASATDVISRLPIGTARQVYAVNSGATAPEWVNNSAIKYDELLYTSSFTKTGNSSYSDIANSSKTITVANASTLAVIAQINVEITASSNNAVTILVNIDGNNVGFETYLGGSNTDIKGVTAAGSASVASGDRVVKLQAKDQFSNDYKINRMILQIWTVED